MWWFAGVALAGTYDDGVAALAEGRFADAKANLEATVAADPSHATAWWELGWARYGLKDFSGAAAAFAKSDGLVSRSSEGDFWVDVAKARAAWWSAPAPTISPVVEQPDAGNGLVIAAVGDTLPGSTLRLGAAGLPPGDPAALLAAVAGPMKAAELTFANLETTVSDDLPSTKCKPDSTSCYAFRTPPSMLASLTAAGVDVVSNANNHAFDTQEAGMIATEAALDAAGLAHAGRYGDIAYLERDGFKVAVVAAHSGSCCLNVNDLDEVTRAVGLADQNADLVIFSFHGGAEGSGAQHVPGKLEIAWGERRGDVKALARTAVDAGADLVLGHGPHVLRAMEVYKGRFIAYSLGNFVGYRQFGTKGGPTAVSAVLEVELAPNGAVRRAKLHPAMLDAEAVPRPDPAGTAIGTINELSAADFPTTGVKVAPDGTISW